MTDASQLLQHTKLLPVITPYDVDGTVQLAAALKSAGIDAIEITLRSDCALDAIQEVQRAGLGLQIGVGTLLDSRQMEEVAALGADFGVSPGSPPVLMELAQRLRFPFIPGVATATEVLLARAQGYRLMKLFPAEALNGVALLKSLAGPFGDVVFCPTGGIDENNLQQYFALKNVLCVGSSALVGKVHYEQRDWQSVADNAKRLLALVKKIR